MLKILPSSLNVLKAIHHVADWCILGVMCDNFNNVYGTPAKSIRMSASGLIKLPEFVKIVHGPSNM